jgi:hypothetical protein
MPQLDVPLVHGRFGATSRRDAWWVQPLVVFLSFSAFIAYSTWAALQGNNYQYKSYLSPFYSPLLYGPGGWLGEQAPSWYPSFVPFSAAVFILWAPVGFRLTCYYYRGAYYKAFWADPPNCTVGEPRKTYLGERSFPLIIQNIHRYFLIFALILIVLLAHDAWEAMWWQDGFHIGVGTLVLTINAILLGCYTLGCHSLQHLAGGIKDVLSRSPIRKTVYDCVSCLNARHMRFAWFSLVWVGFSDVYVRMCAMGVWHDWRIF